MRFVNFQLLNILTFLITECLIHKKKGTWEHRFLLTFSNLKKFKNLCFIVGRKKKLKCKLIEMDANRFCRFLEILLYTGILLLVYKKQLVYLVLTMSSKSSAHTTFYSITRDNESTLVSTFTKWKFTKVLNEINFYSFIDGISTKIIHIPFSNIYLFLINKFFFIFIQNSPMEDSNSPLPHKLFKVSHKQNL